MKLKLCHTESLPSVARTESSSSDDDFSASITSTSSATLSPYCPSKQMQSSACIHANTSDDVSTEFYSKQSTVAPHTGFKKVLVTGGAGFVGSNVAEQLLARGDSVVIVDEMNDYYDVRIKESNLRRLMELAPREDSLKIYRGDICDEEFMLDLFEKERPEWICHMAARAGVRPSIQDPYVYIHSNIRGTTHLLDMARQYHVKVSVLHGHCRVDGDATGRWAMSWIGP
eukprot:scaffold38773_cov43-Cyclotella_meneghiniana.AAC.2